MRSWTVAETARFLEEHDLEGPAVLTRVSGVNGADLLQLSINELSHDIRLTPFAARKVGAARDEFLRGLNITVTRYIRGRNHGTFGYIRVHSGTFGSFLPFPVSLATYETMGNRNTEWFIRCNHPSLS